MTSTDKAVFVDHGLSKYPTTEVLASSESLNWSGIHAERRVHPAGDFVGILPRVTELSLALKGNPKAFVDHYLGGEHHRVVPATGALWLFPEGIAEDSASLTNEVPDIVHVYLPRSLFTALSHEDGYPDLCPENLQFRAGFSDPLVEHLMKAIAVEMLAPSMRGKAFVESAALTLALQLLRTHSTAQGRLARVASSAHGIDDVRLRRVIDFVEAHLEHEIGVNDLAGIACLSPFYFSRAFKRATGYPPYKFLMQRRIEHAKRLLQRSDISIAEIARRCQFASAAGFTRAFTSTVGRAPRQFRQAAGS